MSKTPEVSSDRLKVAADERRLRPLFLGAGGFMAPLLLFTFPLTLSLQSKISPELDVSPSQRSGGRQRRAAPVGQVSSLMTNPDM